MNVVSISSCLVCLFLSSSLFAANTINSVNSAETTTNIVSHQTSGSATYNQSLNEQDLYQYLELSGIRTLLQSIPEQVSSMQEDVIQEQGNHSTDIQILDTLFQAWQQPQIERQLINHLKNAMTEPQLQALIAWQQGATSTMIKQQEQKTDDEAFPQNFVMFLQGLPQSLPSEQQQRLINQLIDSKEMVDAMVELTLAVSRPVLMALLDSPTAKQDGLTVESIEKQLTELEQLLQPELSEQIALLSYYLYANIEADKLIEVINFYNSDLGQLELSFLNQALHQSIDLWQAQYQALSRHTDSSPVAMLGN